VRHRSLATAVLLFLAAVDAAGYSVIAPVLPVVAQETGASPTTIGWLAAVFPLTMLPGLAASGWLIRRGRLRLVLVSSLVIVVIGSLGFVVTTALPALFAARALMGFGSGGLWMAVTLRTLEYFPNEGYQAMSRVYAAYSLGALIGPAIGSLPGVRAPFGAYVALLMVGVAAALALPAPAAAIRYVADHSWRRNVGFWYAGVAIMLGMLSVGLIDGVLPLHFSTLLDQWQIGLLYVATAVVTAAAAVVAGHLRAVVALVVGVAALFAGLALAGATVSVAWWVTGLALIGLSAGSVQTGSTGILLEQVPTDRIVGAMTVWSQLGILGYFLAPAMGGVIAENIGYQALGLVPLLLVVPLVVLGVVTRRQVSGSRTDHAAAR
jgi:MFS family permease